MAAPSPTAAPTNLDIYGHTIAPAPTPIGAFSTFPLTDPIAAATSSPPPGSSATSPARGTTNEDNNNGILNYYFLLLALLVILIGLGYLIFARRQRLKVAQARTNGQRALARDLERWGGGGPWGPGRLRMPRSSPRQSSQQQQRISRRVEGLDERGEAPPPYLPKEPEPAYTNGGQGNEIPLQDMGRMDHKPPDYDEGPSSANPHERADMGPIMRNE
ncbi:MAG: hypothetical protein Q9220_002306 [cf. Caloplaca sp. 1 TL-2023]